MIDNPPRRPTGRPTGWPAIELQTAAAAAAAAAGEKYHYYYYYASAADYVNSPKLRYPAAKCSNSSVCAIDIHCPSLAVGARSLAG